MVKKVRKKLSVFKILLLFLSVGFLLLVGVFIYGVVTDKPPAFFPLDNPKGDYKITKICPAGQGWGENPSNSEDAYCVEYRGPGILMNEDHGYTNVFRITVGKSQIDLAPFLEKHVKSIKGNYASSSKQCIKNICTAIGGPFVVLNIDSLEVSDTKKAVETFSNGKVQGLTFTGEYDDPSFGGFVQQYKDAFRAAYTVDIKTNKVIYFNAYGIENFPKKHTTIITDKEAEKIGLDFARKNLIDFENYTKNAEYSFTQESATKIKVKYYLNWVTKKEDREENLRPYHSIIAVDEYGNIIIFQNEFADRG